MIGLGIVLLAAVVGIVGTSLQQTVQRAELPADAVFDVGEPSRPVDEAQFADSAELITFLQSADSTDNARDFDTYHERRAYDGAPPVVPHEVDPFSYGANDCLQCHASGDFVPSMEAYAPIVPHPELESCNSCHVPILDDGLFVEADWTAADTPELGNAALLTSPPPIPHDLQMRGTCVSCHAGPAAPEELRFDHPEREQCTQCHVLIEADEEWER